MFPEMLGYSQGQILTAKHTGPGQDERKDHYFSLFPPYMVPKMFRDSYDDAWGKRSFPIDSPTALIAWSLTYVAKSDTTPTFFLLDLLLRV